MTRPNLIFTVADDLGDADLACYGGRNGSFGPVSLALDALARRGIRFTHGHANSPVCSPTRFALMTGRYPYRLRGAAEEPIAGKTRGSATLGLPPQHPTVPALLRGAGYRAASIGKWHPGFAPHFGPLKSGYDQFFGPMSGGVDCFTHCDSSGRHDLWRGDAEHPHWPWEARDNHARSPTTMDWTATMLAAAGVASDAACPLDGVSLLPVLGNPAHCFQRPLHWRMKHRGCSRRSCGELGSRRRRHAATLKGRR